MEFRETPLPGVFILEPEVFEDDRGFFYESYNERRFVEAIGVEPRFVQDNHSGSDRGVLRGLHYQLPPQPQAKLVRVVAGAVFDVAVDIRRQSSHFGEWFGTSLTGVNKRQLWVPAGFAHGFLSLIDGSEVLYKATGFYAPELDRSIRWDDSQIGVEWPVVDELQMSSKDATAPSLAAAEVFP